MNENSFCNVKTEYRLWLCNCCTEHNASARDTRMNVHSHTLQLNRSLESGARADLFSEVQLKIQNWNPSLGSSVW